MNVESLNKYKFITNAKVLNKYKVIEEIHICIDAIQIYIYVEKLLNK